MANMTDEQLAAIPELISLGDADQMAEALPGLYEYAQELRKASKRFERACAGCGAVVSGAADFPCIECGSTEGKLLCVAYLELRQENERLKASPRPYVGKGDSDNVLF